MKEEFYDELLEDKEEKVDLRALLFKYIIHWPWFVASVMVCISCAWVYLERSTPMYNINASIIIKDEKKGGTPASDLSAFEDMGILNSSKNIDNEIEVLRSKSLIKDVVKDLGLYITHSTQDGLRRKQLYDNPSIIVHFAPQDAEQLTSPILLQVNSLAGGKLDVNATMGDRSSSFHFAKLPATIPCEAGTITLTSPSKQPLNPTETETVDILIVPPLYVAKQYAAALSIEPTSKTTSVATISLKDSNKERGEHFINKLIQLYNREANDDKNEVAQNTARFINERIAVINQELGSTEQELESFKRSAGLTNLSSDAQLALSEKSEYERRCVENGTQLNLLEYLNDYLGKNDYATLPANVGLTDASLITLIGQYNAAILERSRLLRTSSNSNPVVRKLNEGIEALRQNLTSTIGSVHKGLLISKADLDGQANKFSGRINNAPTQERQFISIQRQQEIKAGLYLMLLQKREENNITLAATANNAKIIDDALADDAPVSPQKKLFYLIALALGMGIPVAVIYLLSALSFRIEGRTDIEKITTVPILADIPLAQREEGHTHSIVVRENCNDLMAEIFRGLRTSLLFMMEGPQKKVILITSTTSSEGKTFVASNLAVSLALLGKKVIILGLDIRKPGLNKVFQLPNKEKGITQYLSTPHNTDVHSLIQPSYVTPNLHLIPGGIVPPNPTELLARKALDDLIALLRQEYDYIVMDTAPIGMVTDTHIISRVADVSIYVCRVGYTHKNDFRLINELQQYQRLPHLCTVINGLDMSKKKYGYYYGYGKYGKYYGYGKRYGYGHGYGYGYGTNENSQHL